MQLVLAVLIGLGLTLSIVQEIPAAWQAAFWADSKRLLTAETTDVSSIDSNRTVNAAQPPNGGIPNVPKIVGPQSGLLELGTPGGKLVVPGGTPATLNGLVTEEGGTQNVIFMLHGSLVEPNPVTGVMEPGLAQSWEISEDQRTITFHLRQGVKFSDGVPFSAADVLFTFNDLIFNDDVTNTLKDRLQVNGKRLQFERVDDFTVRVTLAAPFRPILRSLEIAIYPKHKLANQVAKLNPGVRGILRAVQTFLDSHLEALAAVSKTLVEAANRTLQTLNMTVEVRDATQAEVLAGSLDDTLAQLQGTLTEEDALFSLLRNVRALAANVGALATKAQWEGVPPGNFNQAWPSNAPASDIVGLGPFRFVRVDAGQQVVLERNPFYCTSLSRKGTHGILTFKARREGGYHADSGRTPGTV